MKSIDEILEFHVCSRHEPQAKDILAAMKEYASQFGYSRKQMEDCWFASALWHGQQLTPAPSGNAPDKTQYFASLPQPSHLHSTEQVLKIAGEAWDTALSDQCDVNTYLTQLRNQLNK